MVSVRRPPDHQKPLEMIRRIPDRDHGSATCNADELYLAKNAVVIVRSFERGEWQLDEN